MNATARQRLRAVMRQKCAVHYTEAIPSSPPAEGESENHPEPDTGAPMRWE